MSFCATLRATDVWDSPAFSSTPAELREAADAVKATKDYNATVLLNDYHIGFDSAGRVTEVRHRIYRVETQEGVEGWSEVSAPWSPWHQVKPEIRARIISADGTVHTLDEKTLQDLPVHEDSPDLYSDQRKYGGPLPAIAPGAIIEEEIVYRDTAPYFAAGTSSVRNLAWYVPVNNTRVVLSYPESTPVHYKLRLLPDISVGKSTINGVETVTMQQGPLPAYEEEPANIPPDVSLFPEVEFTNGTTWQRVASEYARLTDEKLRLADVQPLMAKIKTKDGMREQIIRSIVASLHSNVRYTGVEFGESSLIPQFPSEALKRKYGDCKDKAALLVAMLRSAGIDANLALLEAGPGIDVDPDLPGIGSFDHAIVYIPAAGSGPALWVDATAQYSQVGTLPWEDYGRRALIISPATNSLTSTPELTSAQVIHRELREFTMAEYGPARIVETNEDIGPGDADSRNYYSGDSKKLKKDAEKYVKDMYLAESLTALEHGDLSNLEQPAAVKYTATGRRGVTYLDSATMAIRTEGMFNSLPRYFRIAPEKPGATDSETAEKPRKVDWSIRPFTTEWDYSIKAPLGFKVRALPPNANETIGTLTFKQTYSSNAGGTVVEAALRLESTHPRLTAEEGKSLREAVVKALNRDPIFITFDHVGHSLMSEGKVKEGLAAYANVAAQHPKEAVHKAQFARALLVAGLGENARNVAVEATALEPNSFVAYSTLAEVLKYDLVGRQLKKGMDYAGAVAAYKKAIALDPKEKQARIDLALLLEYNAAGTRYADPGSLKEAVGVLGELKKLDEDSEREYEDNVLYDLWYAHDYKGVLEYAGTLPTSEVRKGLAVAATAVEAGVDAALKKSLESTTDESRNKVLANASAVLIRVRKYPEAAAMVAEASKGQSNEGQNRSVALLSRTRPYTEVKFDPGDPCSAVYRMFELIMSDSAKLEDFNRLAYRDPDNTSARLDQKSFDRLMSNARAQMKRSGLPPAVVTDIAVSNMRCVVDGDQSSGFKTTLESPGAPAQTIFVTRDGGAYKIVAFSGGSDSTNTEDLAWMALRELRMNNPAGARVWLDRARERIPSSSGDDPLSGSLFPHFWTKGQDADAAAMRMAALVLLPSIESEAYLVDLKKARDAAKTDSERIWLTLKIAYADSAARRWDDLLAESRALLNAAPSSIRAFNFAETAYQRIHRYSEWNNLVQEKMKQYPDELAYTRSQASLQAEEGRIAESQTILKGLIERGKATEWDLNLYAWQALLLPAPISHETIEMAHRADDLNKNNFAILHTLACVYAQAGNTSQARDYLLKAMDAQQSEEPSSEVWFGFALIAEQYGVVDAAETMFRRVEKPEFEGAGSTYSIAQQHLAMLKGDKSRTDAVAKPSVLPSGGGFLSSTSAY